MSLEDGRCDRCHAKGQALTMSRFNTQMVCPGCEDREKEHPQYARAALAELQSLARGERDFPGIGKPDDL